jgi:DNA-binding response OmpR family regulator
MIRIVIVDDEPLARRRLRKLIAAQPDCELVAQCVDRADAHAAIERLRPDLAFIDMDLSTGHAIELVRGLTSPRPLIVFVTADDQDAIDALEIAAIEYLLKPFDEAQLAATLDRVRAKLSNGRDRDSYERMMTIVESLGERTRRPANGARARIQVADIEIDVPSREVRRAGSRVVLRPKLFELLLALAHRPGQIISRHELLESVWGYKGDVFSRTVDAHLVQLRRKLGHERHEAGYIQTIPKAGYRLLAAPDRAG